MTTSPRSRRCIALFNTPHGEDTAGPHSFRQILSTNGRMPEVLLVPDMKLFAGNATPELAQRIANRLYTSLGDAAVGRFSDGEVSVQINENVRGGDIFIIQSTCAPTNDNLMELVVMVDALRRASAGRITAVIPYFGYARQIVAYVPLVYRLPQKSSLTSCQALALTASSPLTCMLNRSVASLTYRLITYSVAQFC